MTSTWCRPNDQTCAENVCVEQTHTVAPGQTVGEPERDRLHSMVQGLTGSLWEIHNALHDGWVRLNTHRSSTEHGKTTRAMMNLWKCLTAFISIRWVKCSQLRLMYKSTLLTRKVCHYLEDKCNINRLLNQIYIKLLSCAVQTGLSILGFVPWIHQTKKQLFPFSGLCAYMIIAQL